MIEAGFTSRFRIKRFVCIEKSTFDNLTQPFHRLERLLQMRFQIESIVMVASNQTSGSDDKTSPLCDGQDIGRFRLFASLIGD